MKKHHFRWVRYNVLCGFRSFWIWGWFILQVINKHYYVWPGEPSQYLIHYCKKRNIMQVAQITENILWSPYKTWRMSLFTFLHFTLNIHSVLTHFLCYLKHKCVGSTDYWARRGINNVSSFLLNSVYFSCFTQISIVFMKFCRDTNKVYVLLGLSTVKLWC